MCCIQDLACKDVINLNDGCCLGNVNDVDIDICDGCIKAIVIYGKAKFFGLFGREDDMVIPWCNIEKIGEDTILVHCEPSCKPECHPKRGFFNFFR